MYSTSQHSTRHGVDPGATASSRSTRPTSSTNTSSSSSDLSAERAMMLRIQAKLERTHRRLEREHAVQSASIPRSMRYPLPPQSTQPQPAVKSVRVEDMPSTISRHGHAPGTYRRHESGEVPLSSAYRTMTREQQMQASQRSHRHQQQSREGDASRGIASRRMEPPGTSTHRGAEYRPPSRHPYDTYVSRHEGVRTNSYEDQYARPPSSMASPFLMYSSQKRPPPSTAATRHSGHHNHPTTSRHVDQQLPQQSHRPSSRSLAPQQQQHRTTTDAAPSTTRAAAAPPSSRVRFQGYEDDLAKAAAAANGHKRQEPERERAPEKDRRRHEDQPRAGRTHRHEPSNNRPTEPHKIKVPPRSEIDTSAMLLIDDVPVVTSPREGRHRRSLDEVRSGINIMAYDDSHLPPVLNADLALIGERRPRSNSLHEPPVSSRGITNLSPAPAAVPSPTMRERRPRRNSLVEPPPRSEIKVSAFKTVVVPAVEPKKPHMPPTSAINMWALSDSPPLGPQKPASPSPPAVEPSPQPSTPSPVELPLSPVPALKELEVQTQPSSEEFPVVDVTSSEGESDSQTDEDEEMQVHDQPEAELKEEPKAEERQEEQQEFEFSDEELNQESADDDNNFETASFEPLETHHEVAEEADEEIEEPALQSPSESVHAKTTPAPQSSIQTNTARPPYSRPLMTMSQRLGRSPPRLPTAPPSAKPASARVLPSHPQLPTANARAPATTMGRPTVSRPRSPIPAAPKTAGSAALTVPTALSARRARTRGPLDLKHQMPPSLSALSGLSNGSTSFVLNELSFYDVEWKSGEFGFSVQPVYAEQHEDYHDANNERQAERMYLRMLLNTDRSTCKSFRTVRVGDVLVQIGDQQISELVYGQDLSGSALTKLFAHLSTQTPMRLTFQRMDLLDWDGGVEL